MAKIDIDPRDRQYDLGKFEEIASYLGRYYGPAGDDLGAIPISIATVRDSDGAVIGWIVAETPDESTELHDVYETRAEAEAAAELLADELDETPDTSDIIAEIEATGYFDDADIIALVVRAATEHSQGYLLITPDIGQPIGTRWTTNGYLQCDHIRLDATYRTQAEAAEALLKAITSDDSETE